MNETEQQARALDPPVQDTGPGFHAGTAAPLAHALEESTREARAVEQAPEEPGPAVL